MFVVPSTEKLTPGAFVNPNCTAPPERIVEPDVMVIGSVGETTVVAAEAEKLRLSIATSCALPMACARQTSHSVAFGGQLMPTSSATWLK